MKPFYVLLIIILCASCNICDKKDLHMVAKELDIAREIIKNATNCALITVDSEGNAYARTMDPFLPEKDFTIWMATNPKSIKIQEIIRNPKTTLYYFDAKSVRYVSLQGIAKLVNSKEEKEKYWKKEWEKFYQNRTTDYLLIKFTPKKGTIISEKYEILGDSITWEAPYLNF